MSKKPALLPTVSQADLEELIYLRRLLDEAHERWVNKREEIRKVLEAGAAIEHGVHWATLIHDPGNGERLLVR